MRYQTIATITVLWLACLAAYAKQSDSEWILHQSSPTSGNNVIYVSKRAVKIASPFGFELISRAPDWKVHAISAQKKLEWVNDLSGFDGKMMVRPLSAASLVRDKTEEQGTAVKNGIKCRKFATTPKGIEQIWTAAEIDIPPQGAEFLQRFYCSATTGGVPIYRMRYFSGIGKPKKNAWMPDYTHPEKASWKNTLTTVSNKQVPFNPRDFTLPAGYKQTNTITDITYSNDTMSDLTDALDNIGFRADGRKK